VTGNDLNDGDSGPNNLQNTPILIAATISGGNVVIDGETQPNTTVEFFIADPDPTGSGEGRTLLGSEVVTGSGTVPIPFVVSLPVGTLVAGNQVTATATDFTGNTSEFSPNITAN
ncbi:MAG: hypothetical protein R3264_19265, partial [Anaerolineae bacterium]|nr:hypothetical protein [Anaerolineae bacterium]